MKLLTKRQAETLAAIKSYMQIYGYAPTIAELCRLVGTTSKGAMVERLRELELKRAIARTSQWRGIKLLAVDGCCPLCGQVSATSNGGSANAADQKTKAKRASAISTRSTAVE